MACFPVNADARVGQRHPGQRFCLLLLSKARIRSKKGSNQCLAPMSFLCLSARDKVRRCVMRALRVWLNSAKVVVYSNPLSSLAQQEATAPVMVVMQWGEDPVYVSKLCVDFGGRIWWYLAWLLVSIKPTIVLPKAHLLPAFHSHSVNKFGITLQVSEISPQRK